MKKGFVRECCLLNTFIWLLTGGESMFESVG